MRRLWGERQLYFLLSVAIAVMMWYVATAQNPVVSRPLTVELQVRNLDPNEVLIRPAPASPVRVSFRLQGPRAQVDLLKPKDVDAYVDLSGLAPGEHPQVPVVITPPPDVQVVDQRPASVLIVLDAFASKRLPVEISLLGRPPEGITVGTPRASPAYVIVSGPARQVAGVRHALVSVDMASLRGDVGGSMPVVTADANGQAVAGVLVSPKIVGITLVVREGSISKVVPIVPTIVGPAPQTFMVTSATAEPAAVALTGPGSVLRGIQSAPTVPVDVSKAREDFTRRVALQLPPGVTAPFQQVTVTVHLGRGLLSTILRAVPVRVVGVPAGAASRVMPDHVDLQVEGPQDVVRGLTSQAVTVQVSAAGRQMGQYTVAPQAILPQGVHLVVIRPAQVTIILSST